MYLILKIENCQYTLWWKKNKLIEVCKNCNGYIWNILEFDSKEILSSIVQNCMYTFLEYVNSTTILKLMKEKIIKTWTNQIIHWMDFTLTKRYISFHKLESFLGACIWYYNYFVYIKIWLFSFSFVTSVLKIVQSKHVFYKFR